MEKVGPVLTIGKDGRSAKYELWKSLGGKTGLPPLHRSREEGTIICNYVYRIYIYLKKCRQ